MHSESSRAVPSFGMSTRRVFSIATALLAGACAGRSPLSETHTALLPRSLRVAGPAGSPEQLTLGVPLRLSAQSLQQTSDSTWMLSAGAIAGVRNVRVITADGRVRAIHFDAPVGAAGDSVLAALGFSRMRDADAAGFLEMDGGVVRWWEDERTKLLTSGTERYAAAGNGPPGRWHYVHYVLLDRRLSGH